MSVGNVYVVYTTLTKPPKDKITVCICAGESLFFWINTEPRQHGQGQMPLTAADHGALTHNCYLDCSRVTTFSAAEISRAVQRGPITPDLAKRVVEFLRASPPRTLPPRHLALAIRNLEQLF